MRVPESWWPGGSADPGPLVARALQQAVALVSLTAWLSLGAQLPVLVGSRGLLPIADFFARARDGGLGPAELPSWLWLAHGDGALWLGVALGALACLLASVGIATRALLVCSAALYLGYAIACDAFTAFQWDNLLVEVSVLAACLPRDRAAPLAMFVMRLLWFKLYFESGIAKWQSHLGDWQDGSAMSFYYETAPLPTWLAWYAHHWPAWFHRFESWAALAMELVVPFCVFGPRVLRLIAFAYVSTFLIIDTATANYGFFTYLAAALQLVLLRDADLELVRASVRARLPAWLTSGGDPLPSAAPARTPHVSARAACAALACAWIACSFGGALVHFSERARESTTLLRAYRVWEPWRLSNVYHLFGHITRERIEPTFETEQAGAWREHDLHYKPGAVNRAPPLVAPHQPRVDFRLWFYGLSFQQGTPRFVHALLDRICHDPRAVQPLFADVLPAHPDAVRITFYRYHFSAPRERAEHDIYWTRERLGSLAPQACR